MSMTKEEWATLEQLTLLQARFDLEDTIKTGKLNKSFYVMRRSSLDLDALSAPSTLATDDHHSAADRSHAVPPLTNLMYTADSQDGVMRSAADYDDFDGPDYATRPYDAAAFAAADPAATTATHGERSNNTNDGDDNENADPRALSDAAA